MTGNTDQPMPEAANADSDEHLIRSWPAQGRYGEFIQSHPDRQQVMRQWLEEHGISWTDTPILRVDVITVAARPYIKVHRWKPHPVTAGDPTIEQSPLDGHGQPLCQADYVPLVSGPPALPSCDEYTAVESFDVNAQGRYLADLAKTIMNILGPGDGTGDKGTRQELFGLPESEQTDLLGSTYQHRTEPGMVEVSRELLENLYRALTANMALLDRWENLRESIGRDVRLGKPPGHS